ncbi:nitroreductase family protein [Desulfopila aestuarii]|uniref:Nitroreductase n=1 Tax=Desulfopila aestuarii DSM 18488 TaxID=1121416 RepID=A0A1M7Y9R7_9BACT|nr:nitroreductase family protein [Desulfopila aestuarii]SHO49331.1 Nitroreductase [Desulfopila aestuarii DSM 18488]
MQSFTELVTTRRSIRRFQSQSIEKEKLDRILELARWTPSWANTQCWEVIAVTEPQLLEKLAAELSPKNPASLAMARGPLTLAICGEKQKSGFYKGEQSTMLGDWLMFDLGLFTQTISLAAHSEGLGSVVAGFFNHEKVRELLQVPEKYEVVALIPMGYPDHAPSAPKRREVSEFTHYECFGKGQKD